LDALDVGKPFPVCFCGQQGAQQRGSRLLRRPGQQRLDVVIDLDDRGLDPEQVGAQRADVELALHPRRPILQSWRVVRRRPEDSSDGQRRVRLGQRSHKLGSAPSVPASPQMLQYLAHDRAPTVRGDRGEGPADDAAQPTVGLVGEIEDVRVNVFEQWTGRDSKQRGDLPTRERCGPRTEEEITGCSVQDEKRDW
jgi:hypothetical protein